MYDAIVVLGAATRNDRITPVLRERVATAIAHQHEAPRIIVTGGITSGTRSEAAVICDALVAGGVPRETITLEECAMTTAQNARFTRELLPRNARSVLLITQPFHARRAAFLFREQGFTVAVAPMPRSQAKLRWYVREAAAWLKLLTGRR
ncbi:MAG: YdcF family protein [Kofleriaceae bacterium]